MPLNTSMTEMALVLIGPIDSSECCHRATCVQKNNLVLMKKAHSITLILHRFELLILQFLFLDLSLKTYLLKDKSYDDERICSFLNLPIVNLQTQKSFIKKWIKNVHLTMTLKVSKGQSKISKWMIVCRLQDKYQ